jgi:hypothetical protein
MFEDAVPPGATATGENAAACREKFCAAADDGRMRNAAHRHRATMLACRVRSADFAELDVGNQNFDGCDGLELNMSRFGFK